MVTELVLHLVHPLILFSVVGLYALLVLGVVVGVVRAARALRDWVLDVPRPR